MSIYEVWKLYTRNHTKKFSRKKMKEGKKHTHTHTVAHINVGNDRRARNKTWPLKSQNKLQHINN